LGSIKQGSYSGSISNLFDQNDYLPFELWRTKAGLFALVGKSHCLVAAVDKNSRFNCGDLTFVITAKKGAESGKLEGTIKETNLNLKGTWRVDRDVS